LEGNFEWKGIAWDDRSTDVIGILANVWVMYVAGCPTTDIAHPSLIFK